MPQLKLAHEVPFYFRMDERTAQALELLARSQDRSQAAVLRQLIRRAARDLNRNGNSTSEASTELGLDGGHEMTLEGVA